RSATRPPATSMATASAAMPAARGARRRGRPPLRARGPAPAGPLAVVATFRSLALVYACGCVTEPACGKASYGQLEPKLKSLALTPSPSWQDVGVFWFSRHPSTACSATSMMSSDSRLPFGHPCGSPPSGPSRLHAGAESVPHSGVLRLTLSSSLGVTPLGLFT